MPEIEDVKRGRVKKKRQKGGVSLEMESTGGSSDTPPTPDDDL